MKTGDSDRESLLREVLRRFASVAPDASVAPLVRPSHAAIAQVFFVGDGWVLRARAGGPGAEDELTKELAVLDRVQPLLPCRLPRLLPTTDGALFVRNAGDLWTLHEALPGEVRWTWQELERAPDEDRAGLVYKLRALHDQTRGRLGPGAPEAAVEKGRVHLARVGPLLSSGARARISAMLTRLTEAVREVAPENLSFVHGDFHYGNVLLDAAGEVASLIDLDWARVGHPLEDLGYTAMMLVRRTDGTRHRLEDLPRISDWYGVQAAWRDLFTEYVILYALFDVVLFEDATNLPRRAHYVDVQLGLLEDMCGALPRP